jgi:hypothetical protein
MADYVITGADVRPAAGAAEQKIILGETLGSGVPIYKKSTDKKAYKADANASKEAATVIGITTTGGVAGQTALYLPSGNRITLSAVMAVGDIVHLSAAAGGMGPDAPASGSWVTVLGVAESTSVLNINIFNSGIQKA